MYRKKVLFTFALLSGLTLSLALLFVLARPATSQAATMTSSLTSVSNDRPATNSTATGRSAGLHLLAGPLTSVTIAGPTVGITQAGYVFIATTSPTTTTVPITYTWQATEQVPVTNTGGLSDTATFTWTTTGPQTITVTAANDVNAVTGTHVITIYAPPRAALDAAPLTGQPPLTVVFTDTSTGDITAWLWEFGDGVTDTAQSPTHTYNLTGTFTVSLTVSGPGGSDVIVKTDYVQVGKASIVADFAAQPTSGPAPLEVQFTDQSTGTVAAWLWDFGDGITGTQQNSTHTYTTVGVYTVSLTVSGSGITDTVTRTNCITVYEASYTVYLPLVLRNYPLQADFSATPTTGIVPLTVTFTNLSTSGYTFSLWDFGDGTISTQNSPTHTYTMVGAYTVILTISSGSATLPGYIDTMVRPNYITVVTTTPPYEPSDPTPDPDETACQSADVDLSWTGGDPDDDTVTYDVYLEAGDTTPDVLVSDDQSGTTYDPGALTSNTHYYWQIVATDEYGARTEGPVWDFTTCNTPAAPSNLQATVVSWNQIRLDWQDNSSNETGFTINDGAIHVADVAANVTSYTVEGLDPGSYHCFTVRAFNDHGSSAWSGWACTSTTQCGEGIVNGGFEDDTAWEFPATPYPATYTVAITRTGSRAARTGIVETDDITESYSSVQQTVTIPTDVVSATLGFWLYPVSGESVYDLGVPPAFLASALREQASLAGDVQYVLVIDENDNWFTLYWQLTDDQEWTFHEFDLAIYADQTIKVRFGVYNDGIDGVTAMYVDDASLELCVSAARANVSSGERNQVLGQP